MVLYIVDNSSNNSKFEDIDLEVKVFKNAKDAWKHARSLINWCDYQEAKRLELDENSSDYYDFGFTEIIKEPGGAGYIYWSLGEFANAFNDSSWSVNQIVRVRIINI